MPYVTDASTNGRSSLLGEIVGSVIAERLGAVPAILVRRAMAQLQQRAPTSGARTTTTPTTTSRSFTPTGTVSPWPNVQVAPRPVLRQRVPVVDTGTTESAPSSVAPVASTPAYIPESGPPSRMPGWERTAGGWWNTVTGQGAAPVAVAPPVEVGTLPIAGASTGNAMFAGLSATSPILLLAAVAAYFLLDGSSPKRRRRR